MKTDLTKTQLKAGGLTLAVVMSLMGLGYYFNKSNNYNQIVGQEKLKNESLMTEKIHLEKEVLDLTNSLNDWKSKNAILDQSIIEFGKTVSQKDNQIKNLKGGQAKADRLKKEIASLQKLKAELTNKLAELTKSNDDLKNKNNKLQNTIAGLEKDKANLENKLAGVQCLATNSFLVETTKKKQQNLTVKAKRTKHVKVGFDVNQVGAEDVTFKITAPDGKLLDSKTIKVAAKQAKEEYVSTSTELANVQKRIEYTYKPKSKLGKGTYKIEVYKKDTYLGENQFKLN